MKSYSIGFEKAGINLDKLHGKRTTCPQCSADRRKRHDKCLWVDVKHGNYFCHHCGWGGRMDSDEWIKNGENYTPPQIISPRQTQERKKTSYSRPVDNYDRINESALSYLEYRGISKNTAIECRVTSAEHKMIGESLVFRSYFEDRLIRVKYRGIKGKDFSQEANCKPILYKLDDIKTTETAIICEGEIDALSFYEVGLTNAVSLDAGAAHKGARTEGKFKCIEMCARFLKNKKAIYLALDNDDPGSTG